MTRAEFEALAAEFYDACDNETLSEVSRVLRDLVAASVEVAEALTKRGFRVTRLQTHTPPRGSRR